MLSQIKDFVNWVHRRNTEARTWLYNTSMLRTLFFWVLIPIISAAARIAEEVFSK